MVVDDSALPDVEMLRREGLEGTLSEGTPPPPFMPDGAHYPPVEIGGNFEVAMHGGVPRLVDVLSSERDERGALITVRDVLTDEESRIVLPTDYQCSTATSVAEGRRYVILTSASDRDGPPSLYLGVGSEYSILPVEEGWVRTPDGGREAELLVTGSRRGS